MSNRGYLFRVQIRIDPNGQKLRSTAHAIEKVFNEEIIVTGESGKPYIHRIPPGDLGVLKDHSSIGGWLQLEMWLAEPSEVDTAKRVLMVAMRKKVERYEQEAAELRRKFEKIQEGYTHAVNAGTDSGS